MKTRPQILSVKKSLFYLLGVLVALFVVAQELIDYHSFRIAIASENSDQTEGDQDEDELVYEFTCELALPSSVIQIESFIPFFIGTVIRASEEKEIRYQRVTLYDSPHYKNLFRQTISPNAP